MREQINILDVPVDKVTMEEATRRISELVNSTNYNMVFTPNPEIIMLAQENEQLKKILNEAALVVPDGIGVIIGSKILKGDVLPERVPGYELTQNSMSQAVDKGYRYYFLGSKPGVAEQAAENMAIKYPGIQIVGHHDGYFKEEDVSGVIEDINQSGANILLVALGAPRQEIWIYENRDQFTNVRVAVGVGGSLDVMAGTVKRAPIAFQKLGLEWFYRLISQPTRAKRMILIPKFVLKVLKERVK